MKKFFIIPLFFLGFMVNLYSQNKVCISITTPVNGAHVPQYDNIIRFNICHDLQINKVPIIFIKDPNGQWWPYTNYDKTRIQNTLEHKKIQFGEEQDKDKTFLIQVVIIDDNLFKNGFIYKGKNIPIEMGTSLSGGQFDKIKGMFPKDLSPILSVIRL